MMKQPQFSEKLHLTVKALGLVSLLTDVSTKMVYPVTPIFLTGVLGAPVWTVGLIEGVAESTASLLKLYSGWLSDRVERRKPFAMVGYGLGALSKMCLALSTGWGHVFGARLIDRVGKGIRAAPRDALIAENCLPQQRGQAFGLHHSLEKMGEVLGPLLGAVALWQFSHNYRLVFTLSFFPALLGVLVLLMCVQEPRQSARGSRSRPQPTLRGLAPTYQRFLLVVGLFGLGNSSDAFLLLRAQDLGLPSEQILLLYALSNLVEVSFGIAVGQLSDRIGRCPLLASGYLVFAGVYLGFAIAKGTMIIWPLLILYGLYSTLTHGVQKAFVADLVHPQRRGSEIGVFYTVVGVATLPASLIAGWLYTQIGAATPFYVSAAIALLAALLLISINLSSLVQRA